METPLAGWADGAPVRGDDPRLREGAGAGVYTTARVRHGTVVWLDRHVERLGRDARALGLPPPEPAACRRAAGFLVAGTFPVDDGILRLDWRPAADGPPRLVGLARPLAPDPPTWRALCAVAIHPGPHPSGPTKRLGVAELERARAEARAADVEEALLVDDAGRLVEGARSTLVIVARDGTPFTPPLARGGVDGLARRALRNELHETDLDREQIEAAGEIVALNAVRGVRPVVRLDGMPVGSGAPGPVAARLASLLAAAIRG